MDRHFYCLGFGFGFGRVVISVSITVIVLSYLFTSVHLYPLSALLWCGCISFEILCSRDAFIRIMVSAIVVSISVRFTDMLDRSINPTRSCCCSTPHLCSSSSISFPVSQRENLRTEKSDHERHFDHRFERIRTSIIITPLLCVQAARSPSMCPLLRPHTILPRHRYRVYPRVISLRRTPHYSSTPRFMIIHLLLAYQMQRFLILPLTDLGSNPSNFLV